MTPENPGNREPIRNRRRRKRKPEPNPAENRAANSDNPLTAPQGLSGASS